MVINFCGDGCFKIQSGSITVLTEGFKGTEAARMKPDIFIRTSADEMKSENRGGFVVYGPGDYEIKGVEIKGFPKFIYFLQLEDIKVGLITPVDVADIAANPDVYFELKDLDILILPDGETSAKVVRQIHPKIIISSTGTTKELEKLLGLKEEELDRLVVKKKEIPIDAKAARLVSLKV